MEGLDRDTTPEVEAIGSLHFEGNIVPHSWYENVKLESGKPDLVAITLLADLIYWYRPTVVRDERTGKVIAVRKKFAADMLQKSYEEWGAFFGFSKRQTSDAVDRLVKQGLIHREFRTVVVRGLPVSNVMFLAPVVEKIEKITYNFARGDPSNVETSYLPRQNVIPPSPKGNTYTETTAETTTETSKVPALCSVDASQNNQPQDQATITDSTLATSSDEPPQKNDPQTRSLENSLPRVLLAAAVRQAEITSPASPGGHPEKTRSPADEEFDRLPSASMDMPPLELRSAAVASTLAQAEEEAAEVYRQCQRILPMAETPRTRKGLARAVRQIVELRIPRPKLLAYFDYLADQTGEKLRNDPEANWFWILKRLSDWKARNYPKLPTGIGATPITSSTLVF